MPPLCGIFFNISFMKHLITWTIILFAGLSLNAQNYLPDSLKSKYHMLTWEELDNHRNGVKSIKEIIPTAPPTGTVRSIAEWERNQGVIVAYPYYSNYYGTGFGIPIELIAAMAEDVHVYIIYSNESNLSTIENEIAAGDVNTDNVSYHLIPSDTYWTRDFSPWFIAHGDTPEVGIVNFNYNRNRPDDNNVPVEFGNIFGIDVFGMEVEHTGGNYMSDGMYNAASTTLVYEENAELDSYNIGEIEVDSRMEDYLGITDYIIANDPMDDYIYHIDCWAKFLDVDKVLVGEVPETDYRYEDYEAAADYFANQTSSYGNNYEVYRVYSPDGQPYTNSLIMNDKVYVPVPASGSAVDWNNEAVAVYEAAMPGYEIVEVPNTSAPSWQSTDALHCRTHEVPDIGMLHIFHSALYGVQDDLTVYEITAEISSYGGNALYDDSLRVYYSVNNGPWDFVLMANEGGNTFTANIPGQNPGDVIQYYIHAADESARSENHPYMGATDPHEFVVFDPSDIRTENKAVVSLFPNPTKGNLSIALHYLNEKTASIEIFDVNGRVLRSLRIENTGDYHLLRLDVSDLAKGTYFVRFIGETQVKTSKFILR
jgi:agmatine/peptidylarginine deiminase